MKKVIATLLLSCLFFMGWSQPKDKEIKPEKPKASAISNVVFQFDNRTEDYYGVKGKMNGLKLGLESYKRFRFGAAFYSNRQFYPFRAPDIPSDINQTFHMSFTNFFTETVIFKGFRYEVALPIAIGKGQAEINTFKTQNGLPVFDGKDTIGNIKTIDFGLGGYYKPVTWLGLGAGVGYRGNRNNHGTLNEPIATPYFDFKIKLFLGYVYKSIFNKKAIEAERLYYQERRERRMKKFKELIS